MSSVSVVIPTYNRRALVEEAIRSALDQTAGAAEVVVIDDGSTDGTAEALRSFAGPIRVLHQPNRGVASARNLGIREARGELIAFLDSDDLWDRRFLETTTGHLRRYPELALVSTAWKSLASGRRYPPVRQPVLQGDLYPRLMSMRLVRTSTVLARKDVLLAAGGFDESLEMAEDLDLWLRLARRHAIAFLNDPLSGSRKDALNLSKNRLRHLELQLLVLERHHDPARAPRRAFDRRRSGLHLSLGNVQAKRGLRAEAIASFRRAAALDRWSFAAHCSLLLGLLRKPNA
jgi:glycosyltransferase involved in cell wall biosynthesis